MATHTIRPETLEERIVWYAIVGTWGFYALGSLYILAPAVGWLLLLWTLFKLALEGPHTPPREHVRISLLVWMWIAGMLTMELALIVGHLNFDLGMPSLIKSTFGWAKGWALLAIFPIAGCALQIRPAVVVRAASLLAIQTIVLLPLLYLAPKIGIPGSLYVSPLSKLGGPGSEYFEVQLYDRNIMTGAPRYRFWAPWAPAAGLVANVYLILALYERSWRLSAIGVAAGVGMCVLSESRLALVALAVVAASTWGLSRLSKPFISVIMTFITVIATVLVHQILELIQLAQQRFTASRADSSRVRAALARIAQQRWGNEAPLWGHGVVEKGPHLVEYMPIGSHHTWYGLLFVKGLIGLLALLLPMLWSGLEMLVRAQTSRWGRCGLSMMLLLFLFSFGENLEVLVYLFWPALLIVGRASRGRWRNPLARPLAGTRPMDEAKTTPAAG